MERPDGNAEPDADAGANADAEVDVDVELEHAKGVAGSAEDR